MELLCSGLTAQNARNRVNAFIFQVRAQRHRKPEACFGGCTASHCQGKTLAEVVTVTHSDASLA